MEERHIYPIFDRMLQRSDRENLLKQKGLMLWFTGLSGSGKSTLLHIIGAMDDVTGGSYLYNDIPVSKLSKKDLLLMIIFEKKLNSF